MPGRTSADILNDLNRLTREAWEADDLRLTLKCLELEGKAAGMFTEKIKTEISGDPNNKIVVEFVSPKP